MISNPDTAATRGASTAIAWANRGPRLAPDEDMNPPRCRPRPSSPEVSGMTCDNGLGRTIIHPTGKLWCGDSGGTHESGQSGEEQRCERPSRQDVEPQIPAQQSPRADPDGGPIDTAARLSPHAMQGIWPPVLFLMERDDRQKVLERIDQSVERRIVGWCGPRFDECSVGCRIGRRHDPCQIAESEEERSDGDESRHPPEGAQRSIAVSDGHLEHAIPDPLHAPQPCLVTQRVLLGDEYVRRAGLTSAGA